MKFAKLFGLLVSLTLLSPLVAQEELLDQAPGDKPPLNGFFDDELEAIDEQEIARPPIPQTEAAPQNFGTPSSSSNSSGSSSPSSNRFPEPKKVSSSGKSSKSLPSLPGGMDLPNKDEKLRMDFVQVELEELVKYFAERLQKKFIYDPTILQGKITIVSPTEVSLREAWGAFLSALEVRGYVVYPAGPYMKLEKAANARKVPVPVEEGTTPNDDSYVTRIITLKYLNVRDISQAVRNLLSRQGGDLIEHAPTNTLIISDYSYNIRRIIRILDILDIEGFQEQIEIIPLRYASAPDIARKVTDFFPAGQFSAGALGSAPGASPGSGRSRRGGEGGGDADVIQKVVADERTNSLIVLGSERGIEKVRKFIQKLDVATEGGGGKIHVYPVQNVKAEELSQTLSSLTQGAKDKRVGAMLPPPGMPAAPTEADVANLGEVKITADKATNALVIQSSPRDFEVLKGIIRKLDIRRRQVFIEAAILEAKVLKGSAFGVQAAGPLKRFDALDVSSDGTRNPSGLIGALNGLGFDQFLQSAFKDPLALQGMALGFRSGATYDFKVKDAAGNESTIKLPLLSAILKLSAGNSDINILSTPHILATANEEASISIGQEIPQLAGTETTSGGNVSRNITRLRVATELNITPQINANDYLTLKIKQKINDAGDKGTDGQITTINREANTTVIIKDQQTVVIGGLMRDYKNVKVTKVPILGDIPILGWLFKSKDTSIDKVNLLLFLTPYVIKNTGDMSDQFFRKLKEREGFLKEVGMEENKNVPSLGLTEEQLRMLDKEYVKSLQKKFVYPRSNENPEGALQSDQNQSKADTTSMPLPSTPAPSVEPQAKEVPALAPAPKAETEGAVMPPPALPEASPLMPSPEVKALPEAKPSENSKDLTLEDSPPEKSR